MLMSTDKKRIFSSAQEESSNSTNNLENDNNEIDDNINSNKKRRYITETSKPDSDKKKSNNTQEISNNLVAAYEKIHEERKNLAIYPAKDYIVQEFLNTNVMIVVGETGSGKTTQIPQFIYESYLKPLNEQKKQESLEEQANESEKDPKEIKRRRNFVPQKIAITQPRRVAAISISQRVSDELYDPIDNPTPILGEKVGYCIRFEDFTNKEKTELKYMTDGMLLRESQLFFILFSDFSIKNSH